MIALHFAAFLFMTAPGAWGTLATGVGVAALTWAGVLFMWAAVPYRQRGSSPLMLLAVLAANTLYIVLWVAGPVPALTMDLSALLFGALPLTLALINRDRVGSPLRWILVGLYCLLTCFLLLFQSRPDNGSSLAINAILFTVYLGCCIHFSYAYRRATAGAFVTISGFLAWASVFLVAPLMQAFWPSVHPESEVWNLPKYLVAVGMILLLLEEQIEHNKHLALHDHLTGLPNRRLYLDRLGGAIERARRSASPASLLVIDLDGFKQVNDTFGHHVGDLVLQQVAALFSSRVRRSDTVARTGGDEFSVILEEPATRADAMLVGNSLMHLLDEPLKLGKYILRVGASYGVAVFPEDAPEMEALCIAADQRMYAAKHEAETLRKHQGDGPALPLKPRETDEPAMP